MSKMPMSDTQEKQLQPCEAEHTPFKMVSKSNGTSSYYECMHCGYVDFSETIESAKREAIAEYIEPHLQACRDYNGRDYCKNCGLAELKQSEEKV